MFRNFRNGGGRWSRGLRKSPLCAPGHWADSLPQWPGFAGHVSRAMLSRYSHVRMEAKRRALDEIAARQIAADEKRKKEPEQRQQAPVVPHLALVQ